jgi:hypothetical protein
VKKSFNIQELLHRKSKLHGTKHMHPSSSREEELECASGVVEKILMSRI